MRIILIDPEKETVTEVQMENGLKAIYEMLDCKIFCVPMNYENKDAMYSDDESWLRYEGTEKGFMFPTWTYPIIGKSLIIGTDDEGESVDAKSKVTDFTETVIWKDAKYMTEFGMRAGLI